MHGSRRPDPQALRIVVTGEYPVREDAIHEGGIQSVTHELVHALARRPDVECHVVCSTRGAGVSHRRCGNLQVHFVRRPPLPRLATCRAYDVPLLVRRIRSLAPDVVHGQGQDRHGLAAVRSRLPAVVTPHGVIRRESRFLRRHALDLVGACKHLLMDRNEREVFRRARHVILISDYLREVYGGDLPAGVHRIDNPIDSAFFALVPRPEAGRLLFSGTVVARKCVEDLVRTLALLRADEDGEGARSRPPWRLIVAGPLPDPVLAGRLRAMAADTGLGDAMTLTGALSQEDLLLEYARADALLLASREETSPQVIAQAMACGLPVVSSRAGGVPYMVRDGETGLLFPFGDAAGCAAHLRRLAGDGELRGRITEQARAEARSRFHPDQVAEKTVAVYREIVRDPAGAGARGRTHPPARQQARSPEPTPPIASVPEESAR